ncbi:MAG: cytochrome c, partial [Cyclobacteriaceae bacterium]|nr:cytochrome c [Cyclobacteriaceae bacterium]
MKLEPVDDNMSVKFFSYGWGTLEFEQVVFENDKLSGVHKRFELEGIFSMDEFKGKITNNKGIFPIVAKRQSEKRYTIDRSQFAYIMPESSLSPSEKNIDHAGIIEDWDRRAFRRGARIYNSNCINCHGTPEIEGSIPNSQKFWAKPFKAGSDPYSMYQTLSRGFGAMPPQLTLTPKEKYDVILYVQENFVRKSNEDQFVSTSPGYLAGLPDGISKGPDAKPYHPWSDMDYGNFFINTYELVDAETGLERYHSPRPAPYADEDYLDNNFAYKGIAVRLDEGSGGISKGKSWMIFDHDLMRVAGGWTG